MAAHEEVAAGYVSLYARMESSQVSSEISKALSSAFSGSAVSDALEGFSKITGKIGVGLTAGLTIAVHEAKDIIGDLLDTISTTEQADIALTTMFTPEQGSREAAAEFADQYIGYLNEFAIKTPFGFDSALAGARTLIAMGFEGEEVLDNMGDGVLKWSGDMAAALGGDAKTFNNIILQLGHMKSLGHVMSYQMNALARNGVPAWKALAEYMNEANVEIEDFEGYTGNWDVEKVREATREGAIGSDIGIASLEWYSETNYLDLMEQQSHTFTGIMMNMEDAIQTPIRTLYETDAYKHFTGALYDMLDPLRELVTALLPTFELAFEKAAPVIEYATGKIKDFTEALNSGDITPAQILSVFEAIGGILATGPLFLGLSGVSDVLSKVSKKAEKFSAGFGEAISGAFGKATTSIDVGTKKIDKSAKTLGHRLSALADSSKTSMSSFSHSFSAAMSDAMVEINGNKNAKKSAKSIEKIFSIEEGLYKEGFYDLDDMSGVKLRMEDAFAKMNPDKELSDYTKKLDRFSSGVEKSIRKSAEGPFKAISHYNDLLKNGVIDRSTFESATKSIEDAFAKANPGHALRDYGKRYQKATSGLEALVKKSANESFAGMDNAFDRFKKGIISKSQLDETWASMERSFAEANPGRSLKDFGDKYDSRFSELNKHIEKTTKRSAKEALTKIGMYKELLDKGDISLDEFKGKRTDIMRSFETANPGKHLGEYTKAYSQLQREQAKITGSTKTFSNSMKSAFTSTGKKVASATKTISKNVGTLGTTLANVGTTIGTTVAPALTSVGSAATTSATAVATTGLSMFTSFAKVNVAAAAIVGVLGLVGTAAAGAFVSMGGNLKSLGDEVAGVMSNFGVTVYDAMNGLSAAFETILAEDQIAYFFDRLMGGLDSIISMVGLAAPRFTETFGKVFDQVIDGIIALLVKYGPSILSGAIQMFTGLLNGLTTIIGKVTEVLPELVSGIITAIVDNLPALVEAGVKLFTGLVDAFTKVVPLILEELPKLVESLTTAIKTNAPQLFESAKTLFWTIADAVPVLIPIAVEALAGLVTELANSIDSSDTGEFGSKASDLLGKIGSAIGAAAPVALAALGKLLTSLAGKLPGFVDDFLAGGASFIKNLVEGFTGGKSVGISDIADTIVDFLGELTDHAGEFLNAGIGWVGNIINGLIEAAGTLVLQGAKLIVDVVGELAHHGGEFLNTAIGWVGNLINGILEASATILGTIMTFVSGVLNTFLGNDSDFVSTSVQWIGHLIAGIWEGAVTIAGEILTFVGGVISSFTGNDSDFMTVAGQWVGNLISGLLEGAVTLAGELVTFVAGVLASFAGNPQEFINTAINWVGNLISGIFEGAVTIAGEIGKFLIGVVSSFSGNPDEFVNTATGWLGGIINGIVDGTSTVIDSAIRFIDDLLGVTDDYNGNWFDAATAWLGGLVNGFADGVGTAVDLIWQFIDGAISKVPILGDLWAAGKEIVGNIADGVLSTDEAYDSAQQLADDVIAGYTEEIQSDDSAASSTGGMLKSAVQAGMDVAECGSPSRVFKQIGEWCIEGYNNGVSGSDPTTAFPGVKSKITDFFSGSGSWLTQPGKNLVKGLGNGIDGNKSAATNASQSVKTAVFGKFSDSTTFLNVKGQDMTGGLAKGITDKSGSVKTAVQTLKDASKNKLSDASTLLKVKGENITSGFSGGISGKSGLVSTAVQALKKASIDKLSDASTMLKGKGNGVTKGLADGMTAWSALNNVKSAAQTVKSCVDKNVKPSSTWSLGVNVVQGLADGIWAKFYALRDATTAIYNEFSEKLPSWLKVGSPSRLMMEIGGYITEGLAIGIADKQDMVTENMRMVATSAVDAVNEEFAPDSNAFTSMFGDGGDVSIRSDSLVTQMADAFAQKLSGVGVYLSPSETSAQLAPSMDRALGRLSYMGV